MEEEKDGQYRLKNLSAAKRHGGQANPTFEEGQFQGRTGILRK